MKLDKQTLSQLAQKAAADAKAGITAIAEKSKSDKQERQLKKYSPLFPDTYQSESFHIPNIITIVDDAVRRDVEVCEGAIGWLQKTDGEEVLCLYDEAVSFSGIQFIPAPVCNAVYCVDRFDRNRFVQSDCIFSRSLKERIDELQHIAECVGAKRCLIHISESSKSSKFKQATANFSASISQLASKGQEAQEDSPLGNGRIGYGNSNEKGNAQHGHIEAEFRGLRFPKRPTLKWFAHDDSINNLIDTCCSGKRRVKKLTIELSGSTYTTMTQSAACAIDGVLHNVLKIKGAVSMKTQAHNEHQSQMLFHIEF